MCSIFKNPKVVDPLGLYAMNPKLADPLGIANSKVADPLGIRQPMVQKAEQNDRNREGWRHLNDPTTSKPTMQASAIPSMLGGR